MAILALVLVLLMTGGVLLTQDDDGEQDAHLNPLTFIGILEFVFFFFSYFYFEERD